MVHFQNKIGKYPSCKRQRKAKGCIYTCLTGDYDKLPRHSYIDRDWDYICFTDRASLSKTMRDKVWEFRPLIYTASDPVRNARYHKLHPHELLPDYEYSVWVDANLDILTPYFFQVIDDHKDQHLCMPVHYRRNCVYDEISMVAARNLDDYPVILKQREFLLKNHMPEHYGLNETNIVFRRHHEACVINLMKEWWSFIHNFSKRDQLSCSYVLFKNGIRIEDISFANARRDKINFKIRKHTKPFSQTIASIKNRMRQELIFHFGMRWPLRRASRKALSAIEKNIGKFSSPGINEKKRNPAIIISLTSFPERITEVHLTVYSLLSQTLKPDRLILWLADEEFPNGVAELPQTLLNLQKNGLEIRWCKKARSYQKLIPALQEFPYDVIVTADDDLLYPENWLELLYSSYLAKPDGAHAHRVHRIQFDPAGNILQYKNWKHDVKKSAPSFLNFATTGAGTLFPPGIFHPDILNYDLFFKLSPTADDVWCWAMLTLNHKKTILVNPGIRHLTYVNPDRELGLTSQMTLAQLNVQRGGNDIQIHNVMLHYEVLGNYLIGEGDVPLEKTPYVRQI